MLSKGYFRSIDSLSEYHKNGRDNLINYICSRDFFECLYIVQLQRKIKERVIFNIDKDPDYYPRFIGRVEVNGFEDLNTIDRWFKGDKEVEKAKGVFFSLQYNENELSPSKRKIEAVEYIKSNGEKIKEVISLYIKNEIYPIYQEYLDPQDDNDSELINELNFLSNKNLHKVIGLKEIEIVSEEKQGIAYSLYHCEFVLDQHGLILFLHHDRLFNFCGSSDYSEQIDLDKLNIKRGENPVLSFEIKDLSGKPVLKGNATFRQGLDKSTIQKGEYIQTISNGKSTLERRFIKG